MTTFNRFAETVKTEMSKILPEYELSETIVMKMNDNKKHGIIAKYGESKNAPTIYLDDVYEDYCGGRAIDSIAHELASVIKNVPSTPIVSAETLDMSFDSIKDKLTARLIDTELNKEYLKSRPYGLVGAGLAIIAEVNFGKGYSCVITNEIAEQNALDICEVIDTAIENMASRYPARLTSLSSAIIGESTNAFEDVNEVDDINALMSDGAECFGATAIAYKGIAEKIRDLIGDYYVLPSSLHEVIILKDKGEHSIAELKNMVITANETVVDNADILSNSVFRYGANGLRRVG